LLYGEICCFVFGSWVHLFFCKGSCYCGRCL